MPDYSKESVCLLAKKARKANELGVLWEGTQTFVIRGIGEKAIHRYRKRTQNSKLNQLVRTFLEKRGHLWVLEFCWTQVGLLTVSSVTICVLNWSHEQINISLLVIVITYDVIVLLT